MLIQLWQPNAGAGASTAGGRVCGSRAAGRRGDGAGRRRDRAVARRRACDVIAAMAGCCRQQWRCQRARRVIGDLGGYSRGETHVGMVQKWVADAFAPHLCTVGGFSTSSVKDKQWGRHWDCRPRLVIPLCKWPLCRTMHVPEAMRLITPVSLRENSPLIALPQVLRAITARDDGGTALADGVDLVPALLDAGVLQMLLSMLARLAPMQPSGGRPRSADDARGPACLQPGAAMEMAPDDPQWPLRPPYRGYRGDLVAGALNGGLNTCP